MVTASEMGKKGGQAKSQAKAAAARKNAKKPRGKWVTAIAYTLAEVNPAFSFGVVLVAGKAPREQEKLIEWVVHQLRRHGVGLDSTCSFEFHELMVESKLV